MLNLKEMIPLSVALSIGDMAKSGADAVRAKNNVPPQPATNASDIMQMLMLSRLLGPNVPVAPFRPR